MKLLSYLLDSNLAPDERSARGLIMRGDVLINEQPVTSPAAEIKPEDVVRLRRGSSDTDVSRGAQKLRPVWERVKFDCLGHISLDLGVGTGGFTQVLLEQGARRVYAVDVAYGTIALQLRNDPRVVLLERTNARELTRELVPEVITRVVGDLSFISWTAVLPAVIPLTDADAELLLLVKPQFELAAAGRGAELRDGIVEDLKAARSCLENLYNTWCGHGLAPLAVVPAALRGAKGNQEYFVHLKRSDVISLPEYQDLVEAALAEATE